MRNQIQQAARPLPAEHDRPAAPDHDHCQRIEAPWSAAIWALSRDCLGRRFSVGFPFLSWTLCLTALPSVSFLPGRAADQRARGDAPDTVRGHAAQQIPTCNEKTRPASAEKR